MYAISFFLLLMHVSNSFDFNWNWYHIIWRSWYAYDSGPFSYEIRVESAA